MSNNIFKDFLLRLLICNVLIVLAFKYEFNRALFITDTWVPTNDYLSYILICITVSVIFSIIFYKKSK